MQIAMVTIHDDEPHPVIRPQHQGRRHHHHLGRGEAGLRPGREEPWKNEAGQPERDVGGGGETRDRKYLYGPDKNAVLEVGDVVIARGPPDAEKLLHDLCSGEERLEEP
jgi:hypothetical protein